jgi:hypothetical protein
VGNFLTICACCWLLRRTVLCVVNLDGFNIDIEIILSLSYKQCIKIILHIDLTLWASWIPCLRENSNIQKLVFCNLLKLVLIFNLEIQICILTAFVKSVIGSYVHQWTCIVLCTTYITCTWLNGRCLRFMHPVVLIL